MSRFLLVLVTAIASPLCTMAANIIDGHHVSPHVALPSFPPEARARHWVGSCIILLHVRANGTVSDAKVVKSAGHAVFDEEALRKIRTWTFLPERAPFVVKVPCDFRMKLK